MQPGKKMNMEGWERKTKVKSSIMKERVAVWDTA